MRIYEITTEYARGIDKGEIHSRFRVACERFSEALNLAEQKIKRPRVVVIQSIELIADTEL